MIDDKPDVALYLADHRIKALLFDAPYNQEIKQESIIHVYSWKDVERVIMNLNLQFAIDGGWKSGL